MSGAELLVFARCVGFASRAPGFGHPSVPAPVRVVIAFALTLACAPAARDVHAPPGALFTVALVGEALIGAAIGAFASLLYDGAYAGGRVVDDYAGIHALSPGVELVAPSGFGRIWSLAFTGGFFLLGAYRVVIVAFADGFTALPPGAAIGHDALLAYAIALPQTIALVALAVAAPAVALTFVVQIALAATARIVPRLGNVTLTSPIVFASAIVATALAVPLLEGAAAHPFVHPPLLAGRVR